MAGLDRRGLQTHTVGEVLHWMDAALRAGKAGAEHDGGVRLLSDEARVRAILAGLDAMLTSTSLEPAAKFNLALTGAAYLANMSGQQLALIQRPQIRIVK